MEDPPDIPVYDAVHVDSLPSPSSPAPRWSWRQLGCVAVGADGRALVAGAPGQAGDDDRPGDARAYVAGGDGRTPRGPALRGDADGDRHGCSAALPGEGGVAAVMSHMGEEGHVRLWRRDAGPRRRRRPVQHVPTGIRARLPPGRGQVMKIPTGIQISFSCGPRGFGIQTMSFW